MKGHFSLLVERKKNAHLAHCTLRSTNSLRGKVFSSLTLGSRDGTARSSKAAADKKQLTKE